jgi:hypothetical protein
MLAAVSAEESTERIPRASTEAGSTTEERTDLVGSPTAARIFQLGLADEPAPTPAFLLGPTPVLPGAWGTLEVASRVEDELLLDGAESLEVLGVSDSGEGPVSLESPSRVSLDVVDDLRATPPGVVGRAPAAGYPVQDDELRTGPGIHDPAPPVTLPAESGLPPIWGTGEVAVVERIDGEEDDLSLQSLELDAVPEPAVRASAVHLVLGSPGGPISPGPRIWLHLLGPSPASVVARPNRAQGHPPSPVVVVRPGSPPPSAFEGSLEMAALRAGSPAASDTGHPVPVLDELANSDARIQVDLALGERSAPNRQDAHKGTAVAPPEPVRQWTARGKGPEPATDLRSLAEGEAAEGAPDDWLDDGTGGEGRRSEPSGEGPMSPYYSDTHPGRRQRP